MKNLIFDSHAHYDDSQFDDDRDELLSSMLRNSVNTIINCGTDLDDSRRCLEISEKFDRVFCALGIHPSDAGSVPKDFLSTLEKMFEHKKAVAVGEIGLDYHYDYATREEQIDVFEKQIELSKKIGKPVIVHDREAHSDTMDLLKKYRPTGVVHCFSGSVEMSREVLDLGMYIGIGGAVTFKNAKKILDVVKFMPLDRILLETDAPYMTPVPFRGTRCNSEHIFYTAKKVSEIKNIDLIDVLDTISKNSYKLFSIRPF